MSYSEKSYSNYDFIDADKKSACWHCNELTRAVEINFGAYVHRWCVSAIDFMYFKELNKSLTPPPGQQIKSQNSPTYAIMI